MIFDAFIFFNELTLLEIRLHELSDVVDKFVLVEATRTFTGTPKPLYYAENKHLFGEFNDKIIHVVVDDMPMTRAALDTELYGKDRRWLESDYQAGPDWIRERYQRNAIMRGLEAADDNDIVIIEDADEIVRASVIANIERTMCDGSNAVQQHYCAYYLNNFCTNMGWWGSKICRKRHIWTPNEIRFHTKHCAIIEDGGWHYTFMGSVEDKLLKIQSFAHSEFNNPDVASVDRIQERLDKGVDILGRLYQYSKRSLTEQNTPKYVLENLDKFDPFIYKEKLDEI